MIQNMPERISTIFTEKKQSLYFRDEFRKARTIALANAEGFQEILFSLERLGSFLLKRTATLGDYEGKICKLAKSSSLSSNSKKNKVWHSDFSSLYRLVRTARNDALHQGAIARHLTESAVKLSLMIEDAIQQEAKLMNVSDYMIRNPVCANLWQPLSFVRQQMLINSFSFIPFYDEENEKWRFVSDCDLAKYFNSKCNCGTPNRNKKPKCICRETRLAKILADTKDEIVWLSVDDEEIFAEDSIEEILNKFNSKPILVFDNSENHNLVGIVTPFDIL